MKERNWIRTFFFTIIIVLLLIAIGAGGYLCYQMYLERQKTPDEILQIEQEKTQIAYQENLTYVLAAKDKYDFIVVLNPAHGGMDEGNKNEYGVEKDITLAVCERVIEKNTNSKIGIFMTRDDDVAMEESMRVSFLEEVKPDLFIDVHVDKDTKTNAEGTAVYYQTTYYNRKLSNVEFADIMERSVVSAIEGYAKGIFESDEEEMHILSTIVVPAVSISCGNLAAQTEGILLTRQPYQNNLAKGILDGIYQAEEILTEK